MESDNCMYHLRFLIKKILSLHAITYIRLLLVMFSQYFYILHDLLLKPRIHNKLFLAVLRTVTIPRVFIIHISNFLQCSLLLFADMNIQRILIDNNNYLLTTTIIIFLIFKKHI